MRNIGLCCLASEKGKIVVNECLERKIEINTMKLEKLLIIMHGIMLQRYHRPLFNENVVATKYGLMIEEVTHDFLMYSVKFDEKIVEYVCLLNAEEEVMNLVLNIYGEWDSFKLDKKKELRTLSELCYAENMNNIVPNELIEKIFKRDSFFNLDADNSSEVNFEKRLKKQF